MMARTAEWQRRTIGDVVEFFDERRVPLNSRQRSERQGPYPYYGAQGIIDHIDAYVFDGTYLLVPEDGENLNSRKLPVAFFAAGQFWVNNHAHIIRGRAGVADDRFLKHWFQALDLSPYVTGAAQPKLSQASMRRIAIWLPPLLAQRRISTVLSAYDDLIENNTKRIKILEEMAGSLYREWFVNFRFPGHEKAKFVNSKLGKIPDGWPPGVFTDMADILSGGTPTTTMSAYWGGRIPWFTPRDAGSSFYVLDTEKHLTEEGVENCASEEYPEDTIFITARGTVGKLVLAGVPMALNQSCYAIRGKPGYGQRFLYLALLAQVDYLKKNVGGATFGTIVTETFRRMAAMIPPTHLVGKFEDLVAAMFERVRLLNLQNNNLRATRELLLPRLISGEIDVSSLPREPAAS